MFDHQPGYSAEKALWHSVLLVAIDDALIGVAADNGSKVVKIRRCEEARRFLTTPSDDLSLICALAGMDPQAVIERMRKQIAEAPSPEELAGKRKGNRATKNKRKIAPPKPKAKPEPKLITHNGEALTLKEWSDRTGIGQPTLTNRINAGWTVADALTIRPGQAKRRAGEALRAKIEAEVAERERRRRGPNRVLTFNGETLLLGVWATRTGLQAQTIAKRIKNGWPVERALMAGDGRRN